VVEEHNADVSAVILVDDTGTNIDVVLPCEAGARGDAAVGAVWHHDTLQTNKTQLGTEREELCVCHGCLGE